MLCVCGGGVLEVCINSIFIIIVNLCTMNIINLIKGAEHELPSHPIKNKEWERGFYLVF